MKPELTWIFESSVFPNGDVLLNAVRASKKNHLIWDDAFWTDGTFETINNFCLFHGSLANADRIARELPWTPGSFCNEEFYSYSFTHKNFLKYLLNKECMFTSIREVLENPRLPIKGSSFFTRPTSPLKQFSGRVLENRSLSPAHFDYGFYHDDIDLQIIVAETKKVDTEWRFVVVKGKVVTGCQYRAEGRKGVNLSKRNRAWEMAQEIANENLIPELSYAIDICESDGELYLVEMNPFSGADLYFCDGDIIMNSLIDEIVY